MYYVQTAIEYIPLKKDISETILREAVIAVSKARNLSEETLRRRLINLNINAVLKRHNIKPKFVVIQKKKDAR